MYKALFMFILAAAHCLNADNEDPFSIISKIFAKEPNRNTNNESGRSAVAIQPPVNMKESSTITPPINFNPNDWDSIVSQIFDKEPNGNTSNKTGGNTVTTEPPMNVKASSTIKPPINSNSNDWDSIISQIFNKEPNENTSNKSGGNTVATQPPVSVKEPSTISPSINSNPTSDQSMPCKRTDGSSGECVLNNLCSAPEIIEYQIDYIDLHYVETPCDSYLDTCCRIEDKLPVNNPAKPFS